MLENAEKALSFVEGLDYDGFCKDDKAMYAVIRAFEIIGEAARQIPEDVRDANPEIPWREITGMRNKLTHEYFGVNTKVVWRAALCFMPSWIFADTVSTLPSLPACGWLRHRPAT